MQLMHKAAMQIISVMVHLWLLKLGGETTRWVVERVMVLHCAEEASHAASSVMEIS